MQNKTKGTFSLMFEFGRLVRRSVKSDGEICTLPQFETLLYIQEAGSPSMRDIAHHLHIAAPSVTALINELVKTRYIERKSDQSDRRHVRVALTTRGQRFLKDVVTRRTRALNTLFKPVTDKDRDEFDRILRTILSAHQ
jgi:DNA-binding MarR family transcriptional regulator